MRTVHAVSRRDYLDDERDEPEGGRQGHVREIDLLLELMI